MRRFRSPFEKVQRIQQQQLRLAEFNLALAQTAVRKVDEQILQLQKAQTDVENHMVNQFSAAANVASTDIYSVRTLLQKYRNDISDKTERRAKLHSAAMTAQAEYRNLKARCDGIGRLLTKQRDEHRRQRMMDQQAELEESARALSLVNRYEDDIPGSTKGCIEVEDGATQR